MFHFKHIFYITSIAIIINFHNVNFAHGLIEDVLDVIHVTKEVTSGILKTWDIIEQTNLGQEIELPITREKQKKVLRRLKEISRQIELSENKHKNNGAWVIETINDNMKSNTRLELALHELNDIIHRIASRLKQMKTYEKHIDSLQKQTLIAFAEWTVSPHTYAINHLLERLHLLFVGATDLQGTKKSVLSILSDNLESQLKIKYE